MSEHELGDTVDTIYTAVLAGPLAQRGPLLGALDQAGADLSEPQPAVNPSHGLPDIDPTVGWVTCQHTSVDEVAQVASRAGWQLRAHWPTPLCRACHGGTVNGAACQLCAGRGVTNRPAQTAEQRLADELADLRARLARLEGTAG